MQFHLLKLLQYGASLLLLMQYPVVANNQNETVLTLEHRIEQKLEEEQRYGNNIPLHRKRRYLEFPEGSSFQLVYDLIVGMVDYTNYLILGVTVALAWELPSKPPSEILNDLTDRLKDGTLGTTRNDTITNIKYVDTKPTKNQSPPDNKYYTNLQPLFRPPMHWQYYADRRPDSYYRPKQYANWQKYATRKDDWHRKDNSYYSPKPLHPFTKWTSSGGTNSRNSPRITAKYPWWNLASRFNNSMRNRPLVPGSRRFDQRPQPSLWKHGPYSQSTGRSEHRVLPIFGKRSVTNDNANADVPSHRHHGRSIRSSDSFSKVDRIHINHHRQTRRDLYERIESYLEGRGSNGHHCVLRALCETGQKGEEHEPGSFVGELMRALFTLPEAFDRERGYKEQRYDAANGHRGDCSARYHLCKDSLWTSHFVM
ncbi:uncharacterized protein LOC106088888 [Stomoxys calcitrans]|uniref:uncharacterized protein LOC106088888 n=1 Tax=Stomoxys calcitrans TaxID=35570 RepID=UPI0027E21961|nr:uncharacterized protein LOC106088888 [Stomoxys calcitrans]